jgi:hypothetical protein
VGAPEPDPPASPAGSLSVADLRLEPVDRRADVVPADRLGPATAELVAALRAIMPAGGTGHPYSS